MTSKRNHFDVSNYLITTMHDKIVRFQQVVAAHKDTVTNEKDAMGPRLRLIPRGSTRLYSTRLDSPRLPGITKQPWAKTYFTLPHGLLRLSPAILPTACFFKTACSLAWIPALCSFTSFTAQSCLIAVWHLIFKIIIHSEFFDKK